jgi:hypothetical protein
MEDRSKERFSLVILEEALRRSEMLIQAEVE